LGLAPFHVWAPDVYEGSNLPVTALFAILLKLPLVVLLIRVVVELVGFPGGLFVWADNMYYLLLTIGVLSLVIGILGALYQVKIRRLIAFSGVVNMGYVVIAVGCGAFGSMHAALFYTIVYAFLTVSLFSILLSLRTLDGLWLTYISELRFVGRNLPFCGYSLSLTLFSFAGIPPLAGFLSKVTIFTVLVMTGDVYLLTGVALLSIIAACYYVRIIKIVNFEKSVFVATAEIPYALAYIISLCFFFNVFFILIQDLLYFGLL